MQVQSHEKILEYWPAGLAAPDAEKLEMLGKVMDAYMQRMHLCNFTAHRTPERFALNNMVDSTVPFLKGDMVLGDGAKVADIGTGGGFPGVPLAVLVPKADFTLFDSVGKKLRIVDDVCSSLSLNNVRTKQVRLEEFGQGLGGESGREIYDVVTSRAVAHWSMLLELALPMLKTGGMLYAYQGERIFDELESSRGVIELLGGELLDTTSYDLPDAGTRYIVRVQKMKNTPKEYPREYAMMKHRPLLA